MNDLISRQAAIELKPEFLNPNVNRETEEQTAIDRAYARGWNSCNTHWIDEISEMPSAQPERETGEWIEYIPEHGRCPFCGNQVDLLGGKENNFCGECGADMRGKQDG